MKKESIATLMRHIAPVIGDHVQKVVAPLKQRIKELEQKPSLRYCGVWKADVRYGEGAAVTWEGSLWIARSIAQPGEKPGDCDAFQLAVKRGQNGRDGKDAGR